MKKIEDLLVNKGLYYSVELEADDIDEMEMFLSVLYCGRLEMFCIGCGDKRIFQALKPMCFELSSSFDRLDIPYRNCTFTNYFRRIYLTPYVCAKDESHNILFVLQLTEDYKIIKLGQYPSVADVSVGSKNKYRSVLEPKYYDEYSKALGLFSHGIGVGSFVYLRRIIENLVFDKYREVAKDIGVTEEDFKKYSFDEKIKALKDYLPEILVKNSSVYGIISKGIHNLSEEDCKEMFPVLQLGIEAILDHVINEKERREKEKKFTSLVSKKTGELK